VLKKYRPANSTEGDMFIGFWCENCQKRTDCKIIFDTYDLQIDDPGYPKEWHYDDGQPTCSAFSAKKENKVYVSKQQRGYTIFSFDEGVEVIANFVGKNAKKQALKFIKEKGYKADFLPH